MQWPRRPEIHARRSRGSMISGIASSLKEASRLSWGRQRELCMKDGDPLGIVWTRALLWGPESVYLCTLGTWLRLCKGESATESERGKSEGVQARQAALRPWICTTISCARKAGTKWYLVRVTLDSQWMGLLFILWCGSGGSTE